MSNRSKFKYKKKNKVFKSPYFNDNLYKENGDSVNSVSGEGSRLVTLETSARPIPKMTLSFFNIPCVDLAKELLGKVLVRVSNGTVMKGRIVETESYLGGEDKASISYGGKVTEKSKPMYMKPGTTFVYLTYGMYNLINISSKGEFQAV